MKTGEPLSRIRVVLVNPAHPGNIGAAARAMKTMGITRLCLVRPRLFPDPRASALAANAQDVLDSARVFADLDAALAGTTFSVALSARPRELSPIPLDARSAAREIAQTAPRDEIALVFGSETVGLSNQEVVRCSRVAHIPSDSEYASLNLAQAVQVMAYEVRVAVLGVVASSPEREYATHEETEALYASLERSLRASGFLHPRHPRKLMDRLRRLFGRARLEKAEIKILRGMLATWDEMLPKK